MPVESDILNTSDISKTPNLIIKDEIARVNLEMTHEELRNGNYGKPFLDLDTKPYEDYRSGKSAKLPKLPERFSYDGFSYDGYDNDPCFESITRWYI